MGKNYTIQSSKTKNAWEMELKNISIDASEDMIHKYETPWASEEGKGDQNTTFEIRMLMNIKEIKDGCIIKLEIQKRKIYFLKEVLFFALVMLLLFAFISGDFVIAIIFYSIIIIIFLGTVMLMKRKIEKKIIRVLEKI